MTTRHTLSELYDAQDGRYIRHHDLIAYYLKSDADLQARGLNRDQVEDAIDACN